MMSLVLSNVIYLMLRTATPLMLRIVMPVVPGAKELQRGTAPQARLKQTKVASLQRRARSRLMELFAPWLPAQS